VSAQPPLPVRLPAQPCVFVILSFFVFFLMCFLVRAAMTTPTALTAQPAPQPARFF